MLIFALDDEPKMLLMLEAAVRDAEPEAEVLCFSNPADALSELNEKGVAPDVAFLDIEMPGMDGLETAKRINKCSPHTNIVFVTGFAQYALEAISLHPSGYVMKPVTAEKIKKEMDNLRFPVLPLQAHRIRFQCFGNFEVFADGVPLRFERKRTKEVLAYLVDRRGAACNTAEICAVIWEQDDNNAAVHKQFRKHMSDLTRTLRSVGAEDILSKQRDSFAVLTDKVDCDYFDYIADPIVAANAYHGEYMSQYSWGEITHGTLK